MQPKTRMGYDTIQFNLKTNEGQIILPHLDKYEERTSSKDGTIYYVGEFENLRVSVNDYGVTFRNSFATLYHGSNSQLLLPTELHESVTMLNDHFGLNFFDADVRRIDFAGDIILKSAVPQYIASMNRLSKHTKKVDGNGTTIYFRTKHHEIKIYDKVTECREKKRKVPKDYEGFNVMRIEQSYKGRLNQEFGFPVKMIHLTDREFFADLRRRWQERYEAIEKSSPQPMLSSAFENEKELLLFLAKVGLQSYGADRIESEIQAIPDSKKRYTLRQGLRKAERFTGTTLRPSLTRELDNQVQTLIVDSTAGGVIE